MSCYLVTVRVGGDPLRTADHSIAANSAYHARWLFLQLNPDAKLVAIRPAQKNPGDGWLD